MIPQHVCARCNFDLRGGAKISVEAAARRLERSIDDICKAELVKSSSAIHEWVARLQRVPVVAGLGSGRTLANLPTSSRIRCFQLLAQRANGRLIAAENVAIVWRRRIAPTAGDHHGLIARFVEFFDEREGSARSARVQPPDVDLSALLAAYARAINRRSRERHQRDAGWPETMAA